MKINVLNIGSFYISGVSADVQTDERGEPANIRITSYGISRSEGITEGYVNAKEKFKHSVSEVLRKMQGDQEYRLENFYICLTGAYIKGKEQAVQRARSSEMHYITTEDIEKIMESSRSISISPDYEVISVHPNQFRIDESSSTKRPLNLKGRKLEMKSYVVYGESSKIDNIKTALMELNISPSGVFYQPIAAGYAVLTENDFDYGLSVLVDIGHSTTDVAIWKSGELVHASSIPIAGLHITKDIMIALNLKNFDTAERLKLTQGIARDDLVAEDDFINVNGLKSGKTIEIPRRVLARIIYARLYEIFYHVNNILSGYRASDSIPVNVVLVGGSTGIEGIEKLAHEVLNASVSIGEIQGFSNIPPDLEWPSFASTLGTVKLIIENHLITGKMENIPSKSSGESKFKKFLKKFKKTVSEEF